MHDGPPDAETLLRLRGDAGLATYSIEQARQGVANSLFGVTVTFGSEVIGIGRVIGDGGYFFTVSDIAVGPAHQGKGVARMIMTRLTTWLRENAPAKSFVSLFADAGVPPLYEKFGFRICGAEDTGMVWNRDAQ
ncbi:MAG: GNAT family N-acetyltransferase [Hyphomonadaceae bacterium]|nr:GNAT family N-acetyltransferase [Hyphomonadaceae bacterium]